MRTFLPLSIEEIDTREPAETMASRSPVGKGCVFQGTFFGSISGSNRGLNGNVDDLGVKEAEGEWTIKLRALEKLHLLAGVLVEIAVLSTDCASLCSESRMMMVQMRNL